MNELIEILENINPEVDYESCNTLIDDHYLESLSLILLISELEEAYDITIPTSQIIPENFNSAKQIYEMVQRLEEE